MFAGFSWIKHAFEISEYKYFIVCDIITMVYSPFFSMVPRSTLDLLVVYNKKELENGISHHITL